MFQKRVKSDVCVAFGFAATMCQLPEQLLQGMQTKGRRFVGGRCTVVEDDFCIILTFKVLLHVLTGLCLGHSCGTPVMASFLFTS